MTTAPPSVPPAELHADKGPFVLAIIIAFPSVAAFIVFLRLWTRLVIIRTASWEDLAIVAALVFSIGASIAQGFQIHYGLGRHIMTLTMEQGINSLKALAASIVTYSLSLTLIKISILLQYLRIAVQPRFRWWCLFLMWFVGLGYVSFFFAGIFSCYPVPKFWDDRIPGKCLNKSAIWYANAGVNIAQDVALIVLPIFILRQLKMGLRKKIALIGLFSLGGFASIASILRLRSLYVGATSKDPTWDIVDSATWSAIELNTGIVCASLPALRVMAVKYFPKLLFTPINSWRRVTPYQEHSNHSTHEILSNPDDIESSTGIRSARSEKKDHIELASLQIPEPARLSSGSASQPETPT